MDRLHKDATALVEAGTRDGRPNQEIFRSLAELVDVHVPVRVGAVKAPRLMEAWFC